MELQHKFLIGFVAACGLVLLAHELRPKPVSKTRTPQMFEVVSSSFESRLYLDLKNLDTGEVHHLVHVGNRCRGSPRVGSRWELPAVTSVWRSTPRHPGLRRAWRPRDLQRFVDDRAPLDTDGSHPRAAPLAHCRVDLEFEIRPSAVDRVAAHRHPNLPAVPFFTRGRQERMHVPRHHLDGVRSCFRLRRPLPAGGAVLDAFACQSSGLLIQPQSRGYDEAQKFRLNLCEYRTRRAPSQPKAGSCNVFCQCARRCSRLSQHLRPDKHRLPGPAPRFAQARSGCHQVVNRRPSSAQACVELLWRFEGCP